MSEADLLLLLELLGRLHDGTNSRKVATATLVVKRACQARLSRLRRAPRIPSMPLYLDPLQIDFVTDQTPTTVDNPVGTVNNREEVATNGEAERPEEGEALLTPDSPDQLPD